MFNILNNKSMFSGRKVMETINYEIMILMRAKRAKFFKVELQLGVIFLIPPSFYKSYFLIPPFWGLIFF